MIENKLTLVKGVARAVFSNKNVDRIIARADICKELDYMMESIQRDNVSVAKISCDRIKNIMQSIESILYSGDY